VSQEDSSLVQILKRIDGTRISDLDIPLTHQTASPTMEHNDLATRASRGRALVADSLCPAHRGLGEAAKSRG
jgi:hypothetical protein